MKETLQRTTGPELVSELALRPSSVPVSIDNVAARALEYDPLYVIRTKHIRVAYHHVR
jgi:hypothetical protein